MSDKKKPVRAVVVQCRLSSTRLPKKALYPMGEKPLVQWTLEAMKKVDADFYIVATDKDSFGALEPVCNKCGFDCFEGPLEDVLERFCMVVREYKIDTVIRATGDNPFLFYEAAQESADLFDSLRGTEEECSYLTYSGLPHGCGVEIFDGNALLKAAAMTDDPYDHEHAGPAFYRHQENFKCEFKPAPEKYKAADLRTTVDTFGDYLKALLVYNAACGMAGTSDLYAPLTSSEIMKLSRMPEIMKPLIFVPSTRTGNGTGHLVRCLELARNHNCFVYVPGSSDGSQEGIAFSNKIAELVNQAFEKGLKPLQVLNTLPEKGFDCTYIVDAFEMTEGEADFYSASTLITIDDGSDFKEYSDYVLDIIPSVKDSYKPNLRNINFLDLPKLNCPEADTFENIKKILVCFGGEDPAKFALPVSDKLSQMFPYGKEILVVTKDREPTGIFEGLTGIREDGKSIVSYVPYLRNLKDGLINFDLVITHYGLTAFEALASGCAVLLLPTTKLHKSLSEKYGFSNCSLSGLTLSFLKKEFETKRLYNRDFFTANGGKLSESSEEDSDLSLFIKRVAYGKKYSCPVCGKTERKTGKVVSRNKTRTYRRCPDCGIVYVSYSSVPETKYEKEYFFESYKNQYGKTYKEDFENIKSSCVKRIGQINSIEAPEEGSKILDVGCAYGPFLSAASENGWKAYGTDICDDAVESVKKELKLNACVSAFPDIDTQKEFGVQQFDAVTMWYVIEHFQDLKAVLTKVSSLVKKGGVFAFSTPSGQGVSAVTDKDHFYEISPTDHFSVWEPSKAQKILRRFGFKVIKTVSTGHHPERFPEIKEKNIKPGCAEWDKVMKKSLKKNLGDTVEIYCRKI